MSLKKIFFSLSVLGLGSLPFTASAVALTNPLGTTDIRVLAGNIIKAVLGLAGVAAFLMFIWGGAQWIISGGKKETIEKGKQTVVWATLGLVFIFVSYAALYTLLAIIGSAS
ncbi:MAG: hypothetical protein WC702_03540 [Patescibacteria group bacterium]|jgi:hypothetical protein